jgi:uncharacterized membrane protein YqhA
MPDTPQAPSRFLRLLSTSRYLIFLAVIAILVAATSLLLYGGWETAGIVRSILDPALTGPKGTKGLILAFIEVTDLFLLATVLYVIAIGLFELFVDDRLDMPSWLEIRNLDDLKQKLIGVMIVVMGVVFLGQVVTWDGERDLLGYGTGIAVVIAALTYFLSQQPKKSS